jgi:O-antigen/teichoic acid export membrane protein
VTDGIAHAVPEVGPSGVSDVKMGRIARGTTANLAGAIISGVANFALAIAVTRGFSRPEAGVFFATTSLFLLAISVGQLGTDTGLVYFVSRSRALAARGQIAGYVRTALTPVLVTTTAMGIAMFVFAPDLARWTTGDRAGLATDFLRVFAIFIPLSAVQNVALAATRGMGTMRPNALIEQVGRPILQLVLVVVVVAASAHSLLSWAWAFAYAPAALVSWMWWRKARRSLPSAGATDLPPALRRKEFWRFTGPRSLASVVQQAMQRFDIVLVAAISGAVPAAVYAAATRFVVAGQMSRNAVSLAVQPHLAEVLTKRDQVAANHLYQTSTAWLMMVTWPLYLTFAVFGGPLLHIFGHGYDAGMVVLLLLSLSMLVATLCGDVDIVLIMAGRTSWSLANVSLAFAVNLGLDLWLIPSHGVTGAAIGWSVAIVTKNLSALIQVAWVLKLHPFGRTTTTAGLLSVAAFAVLPGLAHIFLGSSWLSLLIGVAVGTAAYLLGLWRFRHDLQLGALSALRRRRGRPRPGSAPGVV